MREEGERGEREREREKKKNYALRGGRLERALTISYYYGLISSHRRLLTPSSVGKYCEKSASTAYRIIASL